MPGSDLAISRLARNGTAAAAALIEADAAGDKNGRISAAELARLSPSAPPRGLTTADVNALHATFTNTLAPAATRGVRLSSQPTIPPAGQVTESAGTAWRAVVGFGHAFPKIRVSDQNGNVVGTMGRRYDFSGVRNAFQDVFGATLTLRAGDGDDSDPVIAEAKPRLIDTKNLGNNFRTLIDVNDAQGNRIGTIRQTWESVGGSILQNLALGHSVFTRYEILDANENIVATSDKVDFFRTTLEVKDETGHAGTFSRRALRLKDNWTYATDGDAQIDRRVLSFMAAYKTMADLKKRQKAWGEFWDAVGDIGAAVAK